MININDLYCENGQWKIPLYRCDDLTKEEIIEKLIGIRIGDTEKDKLDHILRKTVYVAIKCGYCGKITKILGDYDEEQAKYGEISIDGYCSNFNCERKLNLKINLDEIE